MRKQKMDVRIFRLSMGTTVAYWNFCGKCHGELGEPTSTGKITCTLCGKETILSLLGNKF